MSLDWNITEVLKRQGVDTSIEGWQETPAAKAWFDGPGKATEILVFYCMGTGIGVLNDDTIDEYMARIRLMEKVDRALHVGGGLTDDDIVAHLGMTTNVFPAKTRSEWLPQVLGDVLGGQDPFAPVCDHCGARGPLKIKQGWDDDGNSAPDTECQSCGRQRPLEMTYQTAALLVRA